MVVGKINQANNIIGKLGADDPNGDLPLLVGDLVAVSTAVNRMKWSHEPILVGRL